MASKRGTEGGQGAGCTLTASEALGGLPDDGEQHLSHIAEPLRALAVPVASLTPDPANARKHDERNIGAIRSSLSRFGQRLPIVVQKQGMIVRAGNGRLEAAKQLGWTHIAAVVVDEASIDSTAYAIADNRTAELAEWDNAVLADLLEGLRKDSEELLSFTGFDAVDLKILADNLAPIVSLPSEELWKGVPEYTNRDIKDETIRIHVNFANEADMHDFEKLIGQKVSKDSSEGGGFLKSIWHPFKPRRDLDSESYRSQSDQHDEQHDEQPQP